MYCPTCGIENNQQDARFCRACGADLRAVSRALSKSLPVKIANTLEAYLENRYQQNLRSGIVNLIAFIALLSVGLGHLYFGWLKAGAFMVALGGLSLFFGVWDIWIYRRNLPPNANRSLPPTTPETNELPSSEVRPPLIAEPTTKRLRDSLTNGN
jgi:hypothetical protein